tara:strand:+ start:3775 stop:3981 length:207 start_codon:yes stop_codon:yes gene_type:complete
MAFKMAGFSPFTKTDDEYQKNWKVNQGLKEDLKSFQADLKAANEKGDTAMANKIKQDIESVKKQLSKK